MTIRLATNKDREHIFKIWLACFTDDQAYINNYLKSCFPHTKTWILEVEKHQFVSCLSIIPSYFNSENEINKGGYLYAVGTLPEHRGNSYSRILMESAINDCRKDGLSYLLVKPATDSLFNFYSQIFKGTLVKSNTIYQVKDISHDPENNLSIYPLDITELYTLRQDSFAGSYFLWPKKILEYAIFEVLSRSGSCKKIEMISNQHSRFLYYIAYPIEENGKKIHVLETNVRNNKEVECLISAIISEYPCTEDIEIESSSAFFSSERVVSQSALYLSFDATKTESLKKLHLSLPME